MQCLAFQSIARFLMVSMAPAESVIAAQRRSVLAAVRSVALVAHSAARISCGVDKECVASYIGGGTPVDPPSR